MLVKDVFLHDPIAKEAFYVLLRTGLRMNRELRLRELLEAKPALEVFLLNGHRLADLAVKQMLIHQFNGVGFIAVSAGSLCKAISFFVVHKLVRVGLFLHV